MVKVRHMSALKIDWEETSGVIKKRTQSHTRITTAWSMEPIPDYPNYTKIISLSGTGHVFGAAGAAGSDDPFSTVNAAIPFEIASRYVEDCLAKNTLIDLTEANIPNLIAQYGNQGSARPPERKISVPAKNTLG
jgi:hypothetical protein